MCSFPSSLDGLHLALEELVFKDAIVSNDSNDVEGQGESESPEAWTSGASLGSLV